MTVLGTTKNAPRGAGTREGNRICCDRIEALEWNSTAFGLLRHRHRGKPPTGDTNANSLQPSVRRAYHQMSPYVTVTRVKFVRLIRKTIQHNDLKQNCGRMSPKNHAARILLRHFVILPGNELLLRRFSGCGHPAKSGERARNLVLERVRSGSICCRGRGPYNSRGCSDTFPMR